MAKYHINPESGRPNQCTATVRGCKYAVDGKIPEHYNTKEEARAASENKLAHEHGSVATLHKDKTPHIVVNGFPNFNPMKDEPKDFDEAYKETLYERSMAASTLHYAEEAIQREFNPKALDKYTYKRYYTRNRQEVLNEVLAQENPTANTQNLVQKYNSAKKNFDKKDDVVQELNNIFNKRGGWERSYLVPGGHAHRDPNCHTMHKNGKRTQYELMSQYSGMNEKEIVDAAGYRACTECYPSAPVGDEYSLPSKMLTEDEKKNHEAKEKRRIELEAKKAAVVSKAPTISGEPLEIKSGRYGETFKTERTATQWFTETLVYPGHNDEARQEQKEGRFKVLYNIALKHDRPMSEVKEEWDKKAIAKSKKDYKESILNGRRLGWHLHDSYTESEYKEPVLDTYDIDDSLMNMSPRQWDPNNPHIPE